MTIIVKIILLLSVTRNVAPKHRLKHMSDESIENLLYYQDCKHTTTEPPTTPPDPISLRQKISSCPYPKMCCAMSCNNEPCISEQLNNYGNQVHPGLEPLTRMSNPRPFGANPALLRTRKKKFKQPGLQDLPTRRGYGFTKDDIKSLISNDDDIRKILKDLVRVTMQKVDLQGLIKSGAGSTTTTQTTRPSSADDEYEDDL